MWAWRCCRRMSSTTPRETSGALPKWDGIQDADRTSIIKPIMEHFRQVTQAALQEHMNLVTSQYMTGWARASREGGIGAATPMNQPDLSNISAGNPVSTPDQTPVQRRSSPSRAYGGIVPSPTGYSSVASLARRGTSLARAVGRGLVCVRVRACGGVYKWDRRRGGGLGYVG